MNPIHALRLAGPGSTLVARPAGVAHIYTGPLTRSGRSVPRDHRTVCRVHSRRLSVLPVSEDGVGLGKRLCARCSGCLTRVGHPEPTTRDGYRTRYAHLTPWDLVVEARAATNEAELDEVAHLSLVLFGHPGCTQPITRPDGAESNPLHVHVAWHRQRVRGFPRRELEQQRAAASYEITRQRRREQRQAREERIARLGFVAGTRP